MEPVRCAGAGKGDESRAVADAYQSEDEEIDSNAFPMTATARPSRRSPAPLARPLSHAGSRLSFFDIEAVSRPTHRHAPPTFPEERQADRRGARRSIRIRPRRVHTGLPVTRSRDCLFLSTEGWRARVFNNNVRRAGARVFFLRRAVTALRQSSQSTPTPRPPSPFSDRPRCRRNLETRQDTWPRRLTSAVPSRGASPARASLGAVAGVSDFRLVPRAAVPCGFTACTRRRHARGAATARDASRGRPGARAFRAA